MGDIAVKATIETATSASTKDYFYRLKIQRNGGDHYELVIINDFGGYTVDAPWNQAAVKEWERRGLRP